MRQLVDRQHEVCGEGEIIIRPRVGFDDDLLADLVEEVDLGAIEVGDRQIRGFADQDEIARLIFHNPIIGLDDAF